MSLNSVRVQHVPVLSLFGVSKVCTRGVGCITDLIERNRGAGSGKLPVKYLPRATATRGSQSTAALVYYTAT